MKKILTALDNPDFYNKLKKIKEFSVYEKDIQYKEGIIDVLNKDNNFDFIIIYEKVQGEIKLEKLVEKIKTKNNKIKIIFILENKNEKLEKILINENITKFFYNNEINFKDFINQIIYSEEELLKKEIIKLNKIILEKNKEIQKYKENKIIEINKEKNKNEKKNLMIISEIIIYEKIKKELFQNLKEKYKLNYLNINNLNNKKIKNNNILFVLNNNLNDIKKYKKIIEMIKIKKTMKINIIFIENNENINLNILRNIFKKYKIIGKIKMDKEQSIAINEKILNKL